MRDTNEDKPAGLKLRAGIWHIDKTVYTADGRRIQLRESTGCRSLPEATAVLAQRIAETECIGEQVTRERTFAEAAVEYIMDLESRGKDTRRAELDLRMLDATIGRLPLSHVHQGALQTWIADQRGERASGTVARAMRTVIAVLNLAARVLRDGNRPWLSQAVPKLRAPDWGSVQPVRLTWEEQDRLIAGLPAHLAMPTLFALATGARQAEIVTLQWNQQRPALDLPALAIWWIPPEVRKGSARRTASQQQGRFVVCNAAARAILSAQAGKHADLVFPGPNGQQMDRVNNRGWRAALERAGLDCRFHDLRHTFGERAADAGIPLDIRRSLLGHEHRDITLHYSSPGLARLSEEAERIRRPAARLSLVAAA